MEFLHPSAIILMFCMFEGVASTAPESTQLSSNKSSNTFQQGDVVALNCSSIANPAQCQVLFYQGSTLLANVSSNTCSATHVITSIQGCNHETLSCMASNADGDGPKINLTVYVQVKPRILVNSKADNDIIATEGSSFDLTCSATGCPTPNVTKWTKQGQTLTTGQNSTLKHSFATLSRNDSGQYTCTADNGFAGGPFNKTITLDVQYKPEQTRISLNKTAAIFNKGDVVKVTCQAQAHPSRCTIFLYRGTTLLESAISDSCTHIYVFQFESCSQESFRCYARNSAGQGPWVSLQITAQASPEVSILVNSVASKRVDIEEGQGLTIQCKAKGCPTPSMQWRKESIVTDSGSSNTLLHQFTGGLKKEDIGSYTCTAENILGRASPKSIFVNVTYKPTITLSTLSVTLTTNQRLNLTCKVEANPPAVQVEWTRNDTIIARKEHLVLNASDSLSGEYKCVARNSIGMSSKKTVVKAEACANHKCLGKSTCVNSRGTTYHCNCNDGFIGQFCGTKDPISEKFRVIITLTSTPWRSDYSNPSSNAFKSLENRICSEFRTVFKRFQLFILSCKVLSLRNGSVISETELTFNETKYQSDVVKSLRNATSNNTLGSLEVSSTVNTFVVLNPCKIHQCKNEGKCISIDDDRAYKCECKQFRTGRYCENGISFTAGIVLIVLACLVVLIIIIAIIIYCYRRMGTHASFQKEQKPVETELKSVRRRGSEYPKGISNESYMVVEDNERSGSYNIAKAAARNGAFEKKGGNTVPRVTVNEKPVDFIEDEAPRNTNKNAKIPNDRVRFEEAEKSNSALDASSTKGIVKADDDVNTEVEDSTSTNGVAGEEAAVKDEKTKQETETKDMDSNLGEAYGNNAKDKTGNVESDEEKKIDDKNTEEKDQDVNEKDELLKSDGKTGTEDEE